MNSLINQLENKLKSATSNNDMLTIDLKYYETITILSLLKGHEIYLQTIKECFKIQKNILEINEKITCELIARQIESNKLKKIMKRTNYEYNV